MCKRDRPLDENVKGAETLAHLVEVDPDLQIIASITDHLISTLSNYLHYKDVKKISSVDKKEVDWGSEMRRAAFLALAAISANDEEIRDKVIKREGMIDQIMTCMLSSNQAEVAASLRCLQSLTRSVHQIRTVLHDNAVWKPLLGMLQSTNHEIMVLAMTCLCNLVLEFSPSKEVGAVYLNALPSHHLVSHSYEMSSQSLTYCSAESLQTRVIETMRSDCFIKRIEDPVMIIRQKALAVLRNLLTSVHDGEDRDSVATRSRGERRPGDKTALCVLSNMADGPSCKAHIIGKTEDLQYVIKYLDSDVYPDQQRGITLKLPVVQFITNLAESSEDESACFPHAGAYQRMLVLKNLGVQRILEDLLAKCEKSDASINSPLLHSINNALKQFS
ncbi:unnamed protein product [Lymnaea stagnalis]|uniref:Armadillo repeat-containing protein 8 n=1 Tax=Lymnaea stagnalis TaxID=6523 RepID=A0AAV2IFM3_LYMST